MWFKLVTVILTDGAQFGSCTLMAGVRSPRKALVLKAQNRSGEAYGVLQRLQALCEDGRSTEMGVR